MSPSMSPDDNAADGLDASNARPDDNPNANIPRQKRLACLICRRRKLKCDGRRPSCSTCSRLGHQCAYDEVRKKSGPKRGYVKALEERLKQVEVMLKSQDAGPASSAAGDSLHGFTAGDTRSAGLKSGAGPNATKNGSLSKSGNERSASSTTVGSASGAGGRGDFSMADPNAMNLAGGIGRDLDTWQFNAESPQRPGSLDDFNFGNRMAGNMSGMDSNPTWEIVQLNLEEPLPDQGIIDELTEVYFDKIHPSLPMIHKARYLAAMNLSANQRPPVCLRYSMWMSACTVLDKYSDLKDLFYQRARKYLEVDYMKGFGEHMISVAHCQTHVILASYEFKMMYFPRAWMSTGQAIRLAQMIGLHRLDGAGLEVKQCIPPPRDWTEKEERRRTFWMAFCEDRYASIGTGWPMTVDERDISTVLPSSEEAFEMSRPEASIPLHDAMCPSGIGQLTPFAGIILMACLFGRNLTHLHRPDNDDKDSDLNGEFWKRHRNLDNILLNTLLGLPAQLKLPAGLQNPNIVFTNMCIHTSTICLHQAAIFKAENNSLDESVSPESKIRCISAANEIASIMRMVSHMDLSTMNPFISFCLYVAARVFVQYLKSRPDESRAADSLRFLLTAMSALKRRNPLTESFLVQLDVDLEALGERIPQLKSAFPMSYDSPSTGVPQGAANRPGAVCDDGAVDGILSFQKEYSKSDNASSQDNGDDSSKDRVSDTASTSMNSGSSRFRSKPTNEGVAPSASNNWAFSESRLPTRDRSNGQSPMFNIPTGGFADPTVSNILTAGGRPMGFVDEIQDMSTSPGDGLSTRPTPNSSSASESRQTLAPPQQPGAMHSGGSSFDTSPVSPPRGLVGGQQASQVERGSSGGFFAATNGGAADYATGQPVSSAAAGISMNGNGAGLGGLMSADPSSNDYMISEGWNMNGQTGMTPVSEGVLRTIINMGPMETMDLGWGANP
ncbi:hypothetical protein HMPREF1624_02516 [Sporothrix schenckii ATCC 58251]|uniref:Zn(2)-C6 fungal-type domain-containing protein n=1 Tax=Sporothrix schenckii (strain ATCC 58251 / de Perez 2211183) TaxID=1391915 RepID=U7Q043_SPOS1|nr:hypothetical protein HMPREF1624_02516 [Sporothrix schenckii ATCC 58251]